MANKKLSILTLPEGSSSTTYDIDALYLGGKDASQYMLKTSGEWNQEINFGSSGILLIGRFPMYDSGVVIEINATTSDTYHGTLVLATQNIKNTQAGSYKAVVYGDAANTVTPNIFIERLSGTNVFSIYFKPLSWSKNVIHIQALSLNTNPAYGTVAPATDICQNVSSVPATATIQPTNALLSNFYTEAEVDNLIAPAMVMRGTLGTDGTKTSLPTASKTTLGDMYKVITAGTYASIAAKVNDTFVCYTSDNTNYNWMLIPSGDDIEDTWRKVQVNGTTILESGTGTNALNLVAGTYMTITNADGSVTFDAADTGATSVETVGDGNAVTTASYSADTRKLTLTKGSTFLLKSELPPDYVKIDISGNSGTLTAEQLAALKANPHKTVLNWGGYYCFAENLSSTSTYYYSANCTFNGTASIDKKVITLTTSSGAWSYSNYTYENSDTKVTQTVTTSSNTSKRPMLLGYSYSDAATPSFSTVTNTAYASHNIYVAPKDGFLYANKFQGASTSVSWYQGRDSAVFRDTGTTGYHAALSLKTTNGSWEFGTYNATNYHDIPLLTYITDTNYNNKNNSTTYQIRFPLKSGTIALTGDLSSFVAGPASATDNAIARFDATTGKLIQNSGVTIDDTDNLTVPGEMTAATIKKTGGADTHVLLAGGGTKAVSDFASSSIGSGYLPLTGSSTNSATNNMTGPILFKDSNGIILNSNNLDVNVWSVWGNSGSYAEQYGFHLQYKGTGSGNENTLHLYAHNQVGTKQEIYAMTQDGKTTWKTEINFTGGIKEGGTALSSKYAAKNHNHDGTYLKEEADTLQTVTDRGATTNKSIAALSYTVDNTVTIEYDSGYKALKFVFA